MASVAGTPFGVKGTGLDTQKLKTHVRFYKSQCSMAAKFSSRLHPPAGWMCPSGSCGDLNPSVGHRTTSSGEFLGGGSSK